MVTSWWADWGKFTRSRHARYQLITARSVDVTDHVEPLIRLEVTDLNPIPNANANANANGNGSRDGDVNRSGADRGAPAP